MDYITLTEALLPAAIAGIVGTCSIWLGVKQINRIADVSQRQIDASLSAAKLGFQAQVVSSLRRELMQELRLNLTTALTEIQMIPIAARDAGAAASLVDVKRMISAMNAVRLLIDPDDPILTKISVPTVGPDFDWHDEASLQKLTDALLQLGLAMQKREFASAMRMVE
jgi:hypothetical protein